MDDDKMDVDLQRSAVDDDVFVLGDILYDADRPVVYAVRKTTGGTERVERRKHLVHLQRLRRHLASRLALSDVPALPARDQDVQRAQVESLLSFVSARVKDGSLSLASDSELLQFAQSSLPMPGVWHEATGSSRDAAVAPKLRKVIVDVTIAGVKDAIVSPVSWMAEPEKFFAVATLGHQVRSHHAHHTRTTHTTDTSLSPLCRSAS